MLLQAAAQIPQPRLTQSFVLTVTFPFITQILLLHRFLMKALNFISDYANINNM